METRPTPVSAPAPTGTDRDSLWSTREPTTNMATTELVAPPVVEAVPMEVFIVACSLCGLGFILTTVFILFNIRYRNSRIVRMSSPNMNILLSVGAYLAYLCCILSTLGALQQLDNILVTSCQLRAWILPVAFTLMFGAMLTKSWRVRKIFLRAPRKKVVIKDHVLLSIILGLLAGDVLILTFWQAIDPLRVRNVTETLQHESPDDHTTLVTTTHTLMMCASRYSAIWITSVYVYKTFILLYSAYLSWAVRAVTLPAMNDSTAIILSTLLTTVLSMLTAVVAVWFRHFPAVTSSVYVAAIWLCTTVTLCLNFIPKLLLICKNSEDELLKVSMASQVIYSPNQSIDQVEEEIYHLVAENRGLKKSLAQKEMKIKALQEHVSSAKEKLENLFIEEKQDSGLDADLSSSSNHDDDNPSPSANHIPSDQQDMCNHHQTDLYLTEQAQEDQQQQNGSKHFGLFVKRTENGGSTGAGRYVRHNSGSRSSLRSLSQAWARFSRKRASSRSSHETGSLVNGCTLGQLERSRLRHSLGDLVHELHTVDYLSSTLCDSLHEDLSKARSRSSVVYDQVRAKQDITGSIVDSYDLDDMSDTYSYVSNHLTTAHAAHQLPIRYSRNYYCEDSESNFDSASAVNNMRRIPSSESLSTIPNDRYYPSHGKMHRKARRAKKLGRRNSWKREPKPKIFTVFGPKPPVQPAVAKAGVRILYDEGTYV